MQPQTLYQKAILFAASKHQGQTIPGTDLPYLIHLSNVAMEVMLAAANSSDCDLDIALPIALLHDCLEDTNTSFEELKDAFGLEVAQGVAALTKNKDLVKAEQMSDSLSRIKQLRKEVWVVKLADRITNLQAPPLHWDREKRIKYQQDAVVILNELEDGNAYLAKRLKEKITDYSKYLN